MLEVTILSILQGVAEFLPVSSSGHLVIGEHLLGIREGGMRLNVFLHLGTLVAIFAYYRKVVWSLARGLAGADGRVAGIRAWLYVLRIFASALPAIAVYAVFNDRIDALFENAKMVGALLMFTGAMLIGTRYIPQGGKEVNLTRALVMGAAQALALLPGVSRSGMTLAAARGAKIDASKAAEFSFLMSAPLIAGAAVLELFKGMDAGAGEPSWALTAYGAALAAVTGYFSLALLVKALKGRRFWWFGIYCLAAGLSTLVLV